jgi:predicted ester cyclase
MGPLRKIMNAYYRTLDAEGPAATAGYWSENCEFAAPGGRGRGPDFIGQYIQSFYDGNPDLRHTVRTSIEQDDTIALEVTVTGTNTGVLRLPAGDLPPTGRKWQVPVSVVIRFKGREFVSYHVYLDMNEFLGQVGVVPEALTA